MILSFEALERKWIRNMEIDEDHIDSSVTEEATAFSLLCVITILWSFSGKLFKISHVKIQKNFHYLKI